MSNLIRQHYKLIIGIIAFLIMLPLIPIYIEMIFKLGQILGTFIRTF